MGVLMWTAAASILRRPQQPHVIPAASLEIQQQQATVAIREGAKKRPADVDPDGVDGAIADLDLLRAAGAQAHAVEVAGACQQDVAEGP